MTPLSTSEQHGPDKSVTDRLLDAQAELQTALGVLRMYGPTLHPYVEMRLQASLAMQHALLADLGRPMCQPAQMPDEWTPA